ncbi:hypothetical protein [Cellulophaga sp. BC115SP]|uniref:hypothetical protein n=1 Tax=Cellulophaga sp. BC115SP TaxID=2683263 RepID=UPI00141293BF|nr:hypothetical protein [Cellulophaga sp. BC115SP]
MALEYNHRALFLFIILGIRMLSSPLVYLDYSLRKDYIAKNLCQNRNRPSMHCNGKCYLSKQLAKAAEQKEAQQKNAGTNSIIDLYCEICIITNTPKLILPIYEIPNHFFLPIFYLQSFFSKIFKPPIC